MKIKNKKILKVAALMSLMASGTVMSAPLFIEKPRDYMPELVMPSNIKVERDNVEVIDTDPRSRSELIERVKSHKGYGWENMVSSHRFHLEFDQGVSTISKKQLDSLKEFIDKVKENKRARKVVIYGFADKEGTFEANRALSEQRAAGVKKALEKEFKDIVELSSVDWPGDPDKGRRVDILIH